MAPADNIKKDAKAAAEEARGDIKRGAERVADAARETMDDLRNNDSVRRIKQNGAELAETAREKGQEYVERARDEADRLYRAGQRRAGEVADYAGEYYDDVSDMVRRKPAQALGIAAGVGFLVGLILARR